MVRAVAERILREVLLVILLGGRLCHEHDVVGVDVVEVAPPYDVSELTVNAAHRVVFEALAGMAARRRDAAGETPGPPAR